MLRPEVGVILARRWSSYLTLPTFLVDPAGTLIFYNELAESILGRRFEETGEMSFEEWTTVFRPTDEAGQPLLGETLPLMIALREQSPAQRIFWIRALDGSRHCLEVVAFPLWGPGQLLLGALALFQEVQL